MKTFYCSLVVDHYKIKIWRRLPLMITVGRWPKTSTPKEIFSTMSKNTLRKFLCVLSTHLFGKGGLKINSIQKKDWLPIYHNSEKNCKTCEKSCSKSSNLKKHQLTHQAPEICSKCEKSFSTKFSLQHHTKKLLQWSRHSDCP